MALTYAAAQNVSSIGNQLMSIKSVALDNSYPNAGGGNGGYLLSAAQFGLTSITQVFAVANVGGYYVEYNTSTGKLQVFVTPTGGGGNTGSTSGGTPAGVNSAPTLTMDSYTPAGGVGTGSISETVAIAANTGTLAFVPVNVSTIYVTAGGSTGVFDIVPSTATPAAGEVSVNFGTGVLIFNAADAVTSCDVVYQNSGGIFTGTPATLTGAVSAPVFTGSALAGHTHTIAAGGGGAFSEVANTTDLSAVTNLWLIAIGQG